MTDPYKALGLERGATSAQIRAAYLRLAKKHHPDKNPGDRASEWIFKEIQRAYETLRSAKDIQTADEEGSSPTRESRASPSRPTRRSSGSPRTHESRSPLRDRAKRDRVERQKARDRWPKHQNGRHLKVQWEGIVAGLLYLLLAMLLDFLWVPTYPEVMALVVVSVFVGFGAIIWTIWAPLEKLGHFVLKYLKLELVTPLIILGFVGIGIVELLSQPFEWWTPLALIGCVFVILYFLGLIAMVWHCPKGGGGLWSDEGNDFGGE